jgi:hypothetical protein
MLKSRVTLTYPLKEFYLKAIFAFILFSLFIVQTSFANEKIKRKWTNATEKAYLKSVRQICNKRIWPKSKGPSPIFKEIMHKTKKMKKYNTLLNPKLNFKKGDVKLDVYRGGKAIYSAMANLIRGAQHEVLIQTFILDYNSKAAQDYIFKSIVDLYHIHEKRIKSGKAKDPIVVRLVFGSWGRGLNFC